MRKRLFNLGITRVELFFYILFIKNETDNDWNKNDYKSGGIIAMASLSLKHINKTYPNGFEAVKDFNLEIEDKEFIIFVGPSGCGKSTTLRMIAGLEDITSGELKIGDRVVNDVEPKDRDIAMVFQNYALYPHMTVYDNMAFG